MVQTCKMSTAPDQVSTLYSSFSRRSYLETIVGGAALLFVSPSFAFAEKDVADGGLPSGALELNRLLLSQQQVLALN